ncbi:hypothetical protein SAMN05421823_11134 [Catalinimonas alkaloidigena]|uniref:Uncharacterized protein n=1 Tax=Catalinimonas alkaloidigena TaxID=1075417 RepID=A0A1G9R4M1_9BACT|nr:hypothetical protein [Catalinimonas alkaloidigena]SDM18194.1 hypothetical protein SAMN05421823_11134 [Catalinimonas alkaloidigena]
MILWRPVGIHELRLIYESGMKAFPARLAQQPIFYPVLNEPYACQIAKEWNADSDKGCGYVLRFEVKDAYATQFKKQNVGTSEHEELWVIAEVLPELNAQILGMIELTQAFFREDFQGYEPTTRVFGNLHEGLHQPDPLLQWEALEALDAEGQLEEAVINYNKMLFLHFPYWCAMAETDEDFALLGKLRTTWEKQFSARLCSQATLYTPTNTEE